MRKKANCTRKMKWQPNSKARGKLLGTIPEDREFEAPSDSTVRLGDSNQISKNTTGGSEAGVIILERTERSTPTSLVALVLAAKVFNTQGGAAVGGQKSEVAELWQAEGSVIPAN